MLRRHCIVSTSLYLIHLLLIVSRCCINYLVLCTIIQEKAPFQALVKSFEGDTAPASDALLTQVLRISNETQLSIKQSNFIHGKYSQC